MRESTKDLRLQRARGAERQALAMHEDRAHLGLDNWWRSLDRLEIRHVAWCVQLHRLHRGGHMVDEFLPGEIEVTDVGEVEQFWSGSAPTRGRRTQLHFNAFFVKCIQLLLLA